MSTEAKYRKGQKVLLNGHCYKVHKAYLNVNGHRAYDLEIPDSHPLYEVLEHRLMPFPAFPADLSLEARVSKLEATVAALAGIDEPTIERCLASIRNAIDELVNALETTASITDTPEAIRRANAANLADSYIRTLERDLGVQHA